MIVAPPTAILDVLRLGDLEITAYLSRKMLVDLSMSRNGR